MEGVTPASAEDLVHHAPVPIEADSGDEPSSPRVWVPGRRLLTVGMVTLITIGASEALAVATVMPLVERELGDLALYGWVLSAFMLGNLTGIVFAGRLADRLPLETVLALGLVFFVVGLGLGGAAPTMVVLVAARALQGIGAGAIPAVATVTVARAYAPAARPRMFALFSSAWIIPAVLGPGLASKVGVAVGWRWVFGGLVPLALVAGLVTIIALRSVPRATGAREERAPVLVTLLLVAGAAAVLAGLQVQPRWAGAGVTGAGLVLVAIALVRLLPPGTFTFRPGLPATVASKGLFTYAFFAADFYVPFALTDVRGTSPEYAGAVVTAVSLSWAAMAWVQERWVRTAGPRPLVRVGFVLLAGGCALMAAIVVSDLPVWLSFAAWILAGAGAGLLFAPLSAAGLAVAGPGAEGKASAALLLTETLGIALGPGVASAIVEGTKQGGGAVSTGLLAVFAVSEVVALVGAAVAHRIPASVLGRSG